MSEATQEKDYTKTENTTKETPEHDEDHELGGSMTFLEHLGELRDRLIRALVAFAVCTVVCFMYSEPLLKLLMRPLPPELQMKSEDQIEQWYTKHIDEKVNNEGASAKDPSSATSAIVSATSNNKALSESLITRDRTGGLIVTKPFEGIMVYVKISVIGGIFLAFPIIFYQAWMFIAPGLYKREKKIVLPLVVSAWFCFVLGGLFCYFVIYGFIIEFLAFVFTPDFVTINWTLSEYVTITTRFILAFGVIFEEPVVFALLGKIGIVSAKGLGKARPYAIVVMFAASALITPPDPFSQLACALPLYLLYEISILIVRAIQRGSEEEGGESYAG